MHILTISNGFQMKETETDCLAVVVMLARSIPRIQLFTCISWTFDHFHYCYQIPRLSWVDTSWFQSIVEYVHGARNIASKKHKCWSAEFTFYDKKLSIFNLLLSLLSIKVKGSLLEWAPQLRYSRGTRAVKICIEITWNRWTNVLEEPFGAR